MLTVKFYSN